MAGPTFRHTEFEAYKANRQEMPDDLSVQWPIIKESVRVLGIPLYELEGYEADDVIGTVAEEAKRQGIKVIILTGDQDAFQLIEEEGEAVQVLMPGKMGLSMYGRQQVFEKLGIWPEQVVDYKALCGDTSDNIPGIRGIGPKTASQLLSSYQTLDGIYEHVQEIKSQSQKQKLIDGKESAYASQHLAKIVRDVPLEFDFQHCYLVCPPLSVVTEYFTGLEFKKLVGRLPKLLSRFSQDGAAPEEIKATTTVTAALSTTVDGGIITQQITAVMVAEAPPALEELGEPNVITTASELESVLRKIAALGAFAFDLETSGAEPLKSEIYGVALAWSEGFGTNKDGNFDLSVKEAAARQVETVYIPYDRALLDRLKPIFEDSQVLKATHNYKFKANVLSLHGIQLAGVAMDAMLASYVVNPDDKHSLKDIAERTLSYSTVRAKEIGAGGRKQLTINFGTPDKIASSVADDARVSLELARYYLERLDHDQKYLLYEMELPLSAVLARMEQNGVALDLPYLSNFASELTADLNRLESEIYELAGHGF
ncbi:MAG TPA: 5'-3' exonuclease H3TH domain-containing protein, partial [Chroococcales cyanobacterium]